MMNFSRQRDDRTFAIHNRESDDGNGQVITPYRMIHALRAIDDPTQQVRIEVHADVPIELGLELHEAITTMPAPVSVHICPVDATGGAALIAAGADEATIDLGAHLTVAFFGVQRRQRERIVEIFKARTGWTRSELGEIAGRRMDAREAYGMKFVHRVIADEPVAV